MMKNLALGLHYLTQCVKLKTRKIKEKPELTTLFSLWPLIEQPLVHWQKCKIYDEVMRMNPSIKIPHGDDKVTVELTVKELMALTGVRFPDNHHLEVAARKKLHGVLEETFAIEPPVPYQHLK